MTPHPGLITATPTARDLETRAVVAGLVEAFAFAEALAILRSHMKAIEAAQQTETERLYTAWRDLPPADRPDFLDYAHARRARHEKED